MLDKYKLIEESRALNECSFHNWFSKFQKITIKSICLEIPGDIVKYLLDEIILLPKECYAGTIPDNYDGYNDDDDGDDPVTEPEFPQFSGEITRIIDELGGSAYVKTNWHSPKDAFWITAGQTMRVKDITDVYQLLKASGICKDDLINQNLPILNDHQMVDNYLVLKKWLDIHPGTEFRCFVRNHRLIAISPRDWPQYHEHIVTQKKDIINDIRTMFREQIKAKFPLNNYIFDVVRDGKDHVMLIDFSPYGEKWTEPLAFEWTQLLDCPDDDDDDPEFRYLTVDCGIQPNKKNNYGIPMDVIDIFKASHCRNDVNSSAESDGDVNEGCSNFDNFFYNQLRNKCLNEES